MIAESDAQTIRLVNTLLETFKALKGRPCETREVADAFKALHDEPGVKAVLDVAGHAAGQLNGIQAALDRLGSWALTAAEIEELLR